ncbi:MAG TPA: acyl carrier protein [Thermoanaerobaculia bacterium]|nr:acyl carrier protein [Thermoanaerobaculia bacterium]
MDEPVEEAVRSLVRSRAPLARSRAELADDLPLGAGGLGMDSIALVEVLLDCEQRFGMRSGSCSGGWKPADLLQGPPLTVGRLVAHVRAALGS